MNSRKPPGQATDQLVAIYTRISNDRKADKLGVDRQEALCRQLSVDRGLADDGPVTGSSVTVYSDDDITAARKNGKLKERPGFNRLRQDIEAGQIDAVVAYDLDRLLRDPFEAEQFWLLCEQAGMYRILTVADDVDISTGHGLLVARIKAAVAAEEVRKIRQRVLDKHMELAGSGRPSGRAGYGFRNARDEEGRPTLVIDKQEAKAIKEAARRLQRGQSMLRVCDDFNERGIASARGGRWVPTILRSVLTKPSIAGLRMYQGQETKATWAPILKRETWEAVCALLGQPTTTVTGSDGKAMLVNRKRMASRRWLLTTGLARCGECGAGMIGQAARRRPDRAGVMKKATYQCPPPKRGGCSRVQINAEDLDAYVEAVMLSAFSDENVARLLDGRKTDPRGELIRQRDKQQEELDKLTDLYNAGRLTLREQQRMREPIAARLVALESRLRSVPGQVDIATTAKKLRTEWPGYTILQKQAAIGLVFDKIEVRKATPGTRRFDRSRVLFWEGARFETMADVLARIVAAVE